MGRKNTASSNSSQNEVRAEDVKVDEAKAAKKLQKIEGSPLRDLCHKEAHCSILSLENQKVPMRGLLNLLVIIVVVQNARLILENFIKYGVRIRFIKFPKNFSDLVQNWPILLSLIFMQSFFCMAFIFERLIIPWFAKHRFCGSYFVISFIVSSNAFMILYVPYITIKLYEAEPISASLLLSFSITWFLKLLSFHFVCGDIRASLLNNESFEGIPGREHIEKYPTSLSFRHFYTFLVMPTICFQFDYPRTAQVRWVVVLKHAIELILCILMSTVIIQQYITVLLENTFKVETETMSMTQWCIHFFERLMKLSIPNLLVWLLLFMALFHHWLNLLSEITRFADRRFYEDWWNSASIGEYWRKWNLPIHNFVNIHIYRPLTRRQKCSKMFAGQIVFLLSAFAHEYMVCVPLHLKFNGFLFVTFLMQSPLVYLTSTPMFHKYPTLGNVSFWILFCFCGQPLVIIMYYYLWGTKNGLFNAPIWIQRAFELNAMIIPGKL